MREGGRERETGRAGERERGRSCGNFATPLAQCDMTHTRARRHTHTHTHTHTHKHKHSGSRTHAPMPTSACVCFAHARTCARARTHTHTPRSHTHLHIHTFADYSWGERIGVDARQIGVPAHGRMSRTLLRNMLAFLYTHVHSVGARGGVVGVGGKETLRPSSVPFSSLWKASSLSLAVPW